MDSQWKRNLGEIRKSLVDMKKWRPPAAFARNPIDTRHRERENLKTAII
jgi:hypothetical protein